MPTWLDITPFVMLGLLGSVHCAGMCGGFALSVAVASGPARGRALARSLLYVLGKAMTYAVLGLIAAQAIGWLTHAGVGLAPDSSTWVESLRRGVALMTGLAFLVLGLAALGVLPIGPIGRPAAPRAPGGALTRLFTAARSVGGPAGSFGLGLVNGLLPCGLTWAALALAAGRSPATATLGLLAFGLSTAPVLVTIALAGAAVPATTRARLVRFAAPAFLILGLLTLARAGFTPGGIGHDCCAQPTEQAEPTAGR